MLKYAVDCYDADKEPLISALLREIQCANTMEKKKDIVDRFCAGYEKDVLSQLLKYQRENSNGNA
jgi:hypothetical protein